MNKDFLQKLGFLPKNNASSVFCKNYKTAENYSVEVDLEEKKINFGNKIKSESGTTLNFSQEENWVVFECVNRLLEKGYAPEDIILEKIYPTGHGTSGRLDILVKKNKRAYLMIECKTWGLEFAKAFKKLQKDGGQLFTYFQQDRDVEYLVLYASNFDGKEINFKNEIIKIEEHYREAGNVKDSFDRWNKLSKQNGLFDQWAKAYEFQGRALTKKDLKPLTQEDGVSLFNKFEAILRKHTVSDSPNAFNKIFNLFLAKIFDEKKRETDELDFQWKEGADNNVDFQIRLINLHKEGMYEFLKKEIEGIKDSDFSYKTAEELQEKKKKWLKFNKIFDIKEVFDDESFEDNARVLKEVVELLSQYQVRYPRKQQHLSDFFERLLTTGLKQKAGQFFTPPPIARFIIQSLPLKEKVQEKLSGEIPKLPAIIDYAAGSGHFLTESMEEMQKIIDSIDTKNFYPDVVKKVKIWQEDKFDWASQYIYGIEKDYRLVKVAKVGCYFYGDGLAQVIYGDGLDNFFQSESYRGFLKTREQKMENPVFDLVISNPPYSVQRFKTDIKNKNPEESFELHKELTDNSREIESLFVERAKQLLKEGGIAGLVLPSSILSNTGIYTKTREILLKYFQVIGIAELGSGTFMATGTNTVVLFLRRRANDEWEDVKNSVDIFFSNFKDITAGGVEKVFSKYVQHVWEKISFEDFVSLCQGKPNDNLKKNDIYKEYEKKIKAKSEEEKQKIILEIEKEKLLYFILAYPQKVALVKSGKKKEEKSFLGYEFSNRRGYEGIHPIARDKTIDECTKMFDLKDKNNPEKASSYIYKAFLGDQNLEVAEAMKKYVFHSNLIDMLTFDRVDFEKTISLALKKNLKIESRWGQEPLGEVAKIKNGFAFKSEEYVNRGFRVIRIKNVKKGFITDEEPIFIAKEREEEFKNYILNDGDILISMTGNPGRVGVFKKEYMPALLNQRVGKVEIISGDVSKDYLFSVLNTDYFESSVVFLAKGLAQHNISSEEIESIKIPLPPKEIQKKIVEELEVEEKKEEKIKNEIEAGKKKIEKLFRDVLAKSKKNLRLSDNSVFDVFIGKRLLKSQILSSGDYPVFSANVFEPFGYVNTLLIKDFSAPSVLWGIDGDWMVNYYPKEKPFYPTDHCGVLRVKNNMINERYLAFVLEKEGKNFEFSRTKRASIDKIKDIKIPAPSLSEQQKIVSQIQKIEDQISELNSELEKIKNQKKAILKKYL